MVAYLEKKNNKDIKNSSNKICTLLDMSIKDIIKEGHITLLEFYKKVYKIIINNNNFNIIINKILKLLKNSRTKFYLGIIIIIVSLFIYYIVS